MAGQMMQEAAGKAIPAGYKQTEVGVIPEDWSFYRLGDLEPYITSGSRGWAKFYSKHGDVFVRITNMSRESIYLDLKDICYVMIDAASSEGKRTSLEEGDVLVSITADIGICSYIDSSLDKPAFINQHIALIRFNHAKINSKFIAYYLSSHQIQKLFKGSTDQGAKAGMNLDAVRMIKTALPTLQEQTAIANVLSDSDALIGALEQLIAKKQAIKSATMQQLLTGRTRLPAFALRPDGTPKGFKPSELGDIPEDWEVAPIGSVLSITTGARNTQDKVDDGRYPFFVRSQTVERINTYSFDGEAVLTAGDGVGTGKIFHYVNGKFDFHQRVYLMYNFGERVSGYFFYLFFSNNFFERIMSMTAKSSVDSVRREMIADMKMVLPSKVEQTAIATILSDMDNELEALTQKLEKARALKQGMMQQLLTGKIRLPLAVWA